MPSLPDPRSPAAGLPLVGRRLDLERCAAALDDGAAAVLIHGPAGVGKTRLADECLEVARSAGRATGRAGSSAGASTVPLGALVHLLPAPVIDHGVDPVVLYAEVAADLRRQAGDLPFVLFVDDLHLLDPTSATLLRQLLDGGVVFLIATVRTGEPLAGAVAGLVGREPVVRLDLADLSRDDVDTLLHLTLGGPVAAGTVSAVWTTSGGNALFVRELVLGARAAGRLVEEGGVWSLSGPLVSTARLLEVVEARVGPVEGPARAVLDLLALWEPVGLADVEELGGLDSLERLEDAGLITVRLDRRRQLVTLAHPLYGEALRARLPMLRKRRLLLDHADHIGAHGARRRDDPLRIATARLDAAGSADPDLLVAAARLARYGHDHVNVVRLARAALVERESPEGVLLLAEALHELGSYAETEEVFARRGAELPGADDEVGLQLVAIRVRSMAFGLHRPDEALAMNRAAQAAVAGHIAKDDLIADEGIVLLYSNRPLEVLEALEEISDDAVPRTRVLRALSEATALTLTGRCETALVVAQRALAEHRALGDQVAIAHADIHLVFRMHALTESGRLTEATTLAAAGHRGASAGGPPLGRVWFATGLGRAAVLAGQPRTAHRWLAEAAAACAGGGFDGPRRVVLALLAMAAAWLGDADEAEATVDELDRLAPFGHSRSEQELGRAWAAVARGEPERARAVLRVAADEAAATGHLAGEAWLRHDIARLGDPASVADRLGALAEVCEGALVPAYADHARGLTNQDPAVLNEVSHRFEALDASLLAAEAATAGGRAFRRNGQPRQATAALARAAALHERCEGARTPGLVSTDAVVPLSRREREVAVLAAGRLSSKEIAERLFLSVRTVDNHLQSAYTKLGVSHRSDLAAALGDNGTPGA